MIINLAKFSLHHWTLSDSAALEIRLYQPANQLALEIFSVLMLGLEFLKMANMD